LENAVQAMVGDFHKLYDIRSSLHLVYLKLVLAMVKAYLVGPKAPLS
jgi:hypothetical protein